MRFAHAHYRRLYDHRIFSITIKSQRGRGYTRIAVEARSPVRSGAAVRQRQPLTKHQLPAVNFPPLQPLYSFTPKATFATTCVTEVVEPPARIDAQIAGVESAIGWVFKDKSFCATALQMQTKLGVTLTFGGSDYFTEHNKVLEQMGDRIMLAVLCKKWLQSQEYSYNLLQWHKTQQSLISNAALAERGFALGLDAFVIRNSGTPAVSKYMMANTFEAIFGAVYMDAGEAGSKAVYHVLEHTGFIKDMLLSGTILADL